MNLAGQLVGALGVVSVDVDVIVTPFDLDPEEAGTVTVVCEGTGEEAADDATPPPTETPATAAMMVTARSPEMVPVQARAAIAPMTARVTRTCVKLFSRFATFHLSRIRPLRPSRRS
jgi:hypothetical protein